MYVQLKEDLVLASWVVRLVDLYSSICKKVKVAINNTNIDGLRIPCSQPLFQVMVIEQYRWHDTMALLLCKPTPMKSTLLAHNSCFSGGGDRDV